jgi:hypothetical protein
MRNATTGITQSRYTLLNYISTKIRNLSRKIFNNRVLFISLIMYDTVTYREHIRILWRFYRTNFLFGINKILSKKWQYQPEIKLFLSFIRFVESNIKGLYNPIKAIQPYCKSPIVCSFTAVALFLSLCG